MANIALGKKIMEDWKAPNELTNGNYTNYTGKVGFTSSVWPKNLTLDLEDIYYIETIRFLLYDKDTRLYKYRILTSEDVTHWSVHYDTDDGGYRGWQEFTFQDKIKARYIRIHCMWNSQNNNFHIVELQVYDKDTEILNLNIANKRIISTKKITSSIEIGTGLPITRMMINLTNSLETILNEHQVINPKPFKEIINSLRIQVNDIESLENSVDSIRREIIDPVKQELEEGRELGKFSKWGFYVGFIAIIVSIFAILNGVFNWI